MAAEEALPDPGPGSSAAEGLATMRDAILGPVAETTDGVRADALRRGYSAETAEAMALEAYRYLLAVLTAAT